MTPRPALSLWRAEVTEEWGRRPGTAAAEAPGGLDVWCVSELHADIHAAEIGWRSVLRSSQKVVLDIGYDDIGDDLTSVVHRVASFVDVELPPDTNVTPTYVRQADEVTDRFERQWQAATGGCAACRSNPLQL